MKLGFDAKRAFHNQTGLGSYSRSLIQLLAKHYPENEYLLFTPKINGNNYFSNLNNIKIIEPERFIDKKLSSYWRTFTQYKQIGENNIDIFHGLSNELPKNIAKTKAKSIVTIHDLIFIRFPELYKFIDRKIYYSKFKFACQKADKIIAISIQTKEDIVNYFKINPDKIEIVYQGCNPVFYNIIDENSKSEIRAKYNLPENYILYVGTIEPRKNALSIVKALKIGKIEKPLVIVGRKTPYFEEIAKFIEENNLQNQVKFIHNVQFNELPALYQMADIFVYPSFFEGFGIPILEAINSKIPVITSTGSCFAETGGESSIYINPHKPEEIAEKLNDFYSGKLNTRQIIEKGLQHAENFKEENIVKNIMKVYKSVL